MASRILRMMPYSTHYVEPFCGGASIFLRKPRCENNWLNDKRHDLINLYSSIQNYPEELSRRVPEITNDYSHQRDVFFYYKDEFRVKDRIDSGLRLLIVNRLSYGGLENGYFSPRSTCRLNEVVTEKIKGIILKFNHIFRDVTLTCMDFEKVISSLDDDYLLYCDPPYHRCNNSLYQHKFYEEDHIRLRDALNSRMDNVKFILSYDDTKFIRSLYEKFHIMNITLPYSINKKEYKSELIITNFRVRNLSDYEDSNYELFKERDLYT